MKANYQYIYRDYWFIYRGPGFLAIAWFGSSSAPLFCPSARCLSFSIFMCVPVDLTDGGGRGRARSQIIGPQETTELLYSKGCIHYMRYIELVLGERTFNYHNIALCEYQLKVAWVGMLGWEFKGTVSRDFRLLVFFMDQFPPSPWVYH
jgi:hypothetical protein